MQTVTPRLSVGPQAAGPTWWSEGTTRPTSGEWSRKRVTAEVDDEAKRPSEKVVIVGGVESSSI